MAAEDPSLVFLLCASGKGERGSEGEEGRESEHRKRDVKKGRKRESEKKEDNEFKKRTFDGTMLKILGCEMQK